MAKLDNVKRIVSDDFKSEDRDTVDKLAYILNDFMQQVVETINNGLDYENIQQEKKSIEVQVDVNGVPFVGNKVRTTISVAGCQVIKVENLTNGAVPTSHPFITFSQSGTTLNIQHVTGLAVGNKYKLTVILFSN